MILENNIFYATLYIIGAFIVGSIPFAYIASKLKRGEDIREVGSGNPGATNVLRVYGATLGVVVLILDILKGVVPVLIAVKLTTAVSTNALIIIHLTAVAVVLGHDFSPFLRFKGGKGVATSFGAFVVLNWLPVILVLSIMLILTYVFKFISFGSVVAAFAFPGLMFVLGRTANTEFFWLSVIFAVLIIAKHRLNLSRLWNGNENKAV
ncbi:MAG: glycerol-3-phosphate 1-O-acyltransferase PlsY [Elusimicrobia bacterium]|jgi:glycerol-3-phosphate acyltransferase PlsY|nr:glycerol-3-phosphate 1-O-acyltransferase PlsY [Elusimicrobiota bacterium]